MSTSLENTVYDIVRGAIGSHLAERLSKSYQSPLDPFLKAVVEKHAGEITAIYEDAVTTAIKGVDLRDALREAFSHKLAKLLVTQFEGAIEKRANEMRSDPVFRAKVVLAIEAAIKESKK